MESTNTAYQVWKSRRLRDSFLKNIRKAVPFAAEQIELLLRVAVTWQPHLTSFMDVGCGDGILGRAILSVYPQARGVFLDFAGGMLEVAREKGPVNDSIRFIQADFSSPDWTRRVGEAAAFDLIISGFSIHHQTDQRKRELYQEIYRLLSPGGVFLNLEHVASASEQIESMFDEYFIDSLYEYSRQTGSERSREEIAGAHYNRPDAEANILAPVEDQCRWLREIGFRDVDCFFKVFELALFGGRKANE